MYTIESFCNSIWELSFFKVLQCVTKEDYKEFEIPKKRGVRKINYLSTNSKLAGLQKKLLTNFLEKQEIPVCVKGFKKGESYKTFLLPHVDSTFFLRIDIENFFPTISDIQIKKALSPIIVCNPDDEKAKLLDLIVDIVTLDKVLPQGACTSPTISNLVMARIDQRILKYCQILHVKYTRYADDLLFSSTVLDFQNKKWFLRKIKYILSNLSLKMNYSKIKYGREQLVLNGYIISDMGIQLSRNRLSDIRHVCSFVKTNHTMIKSSGSAAFLTAANALQLKHRDLHRYPFGSIFQLIQYLCGYRAFLISLVDTNSKSSSFQKNLQKLIRRIETQIILLS